MQMVFNLLIAVSVFVLLYGRLGGLKAMKDTSIRDGLMYVVHSVLTFWVGLAIPIMIGVMLAPYL